MVWGTEPCSWAGSVGFEVGHWGLGFFFFWMLNTRIIRHCNHIEVQSSVALSMFTLCSPHQHRLQVSTKPTCAKDALAPTPSHPVTHLTHLSEFEAVGF